MRIPAFVRRSGLAKMRVHFSRGYALP